MLFNNHEPVLKNECCELNHGLLNTVSINTEYYIHAEGKIHCRLLCSSASASGKINWHTYHIVQLTNIY